MFFLQLCNLALLCSLWESLTSTLQSASPLNTKLFLSRRFYSTDLKPDTWNFKRANVACLDFLYFKMTFLVWQQMVGNKRRRWRPKWLSQGFQCEMSQWQLPYLANINNICFILVVKMNTIKDLCKYLWRHEDKSFWFAVQDLRINQLLFNLWTVSHDYTFIERVYFDCFPIFYWTIYPVRAK